MIFGCSVFTLLLLLLYFSYAYHLALTIAVTTLAMISIVLAQQRGKQVKVIYQFELSQQGLCTFDGQRYYQLQANSRLSFLGCWLTLTSVTENSTRLASKYKQLFIYRDSLSQKDFSRLSLVLRKLSTE